MRSQPLYRLQLALLGHGAEVHQIDRPFDVRSLETVRGAGYRLRKDGGR